MKMILYSLKVCLYQIRIISKKLQNIYNPRMSVYFYEKLPGSFS